MRSLAYVALAFMLVTCRTGRQAARVHTQTVHNRLAEFRLPENANADTKRIYEAVRHHDRELAIINNPNFGTYPGDTDAFIILSGRTPATLSLQIN